MSIFNTNNRRRLNSLTFGLILMLSTITTVISPFIANAGTITRGSSSAETELVAEIKKYEEVAALGNCMDKHNNDRGGDNVTPQDAYNGNWFADDVKAFVGSMSKSGFDVSDCNGLVKAVSAHLGFAENYMGFFCSFVKFDRNKVPCDDTRVGNFYALDWEVRDGSGNKQSNYTYSDAFFDKYKNSVSLSDAAKYLVYLNSLLNTGVCDATSSSSVLGSSITVKIPTVKTDYYSIKDGVLGTKVTSNTVLEYINTQINATGAVPEGYAPKNTASMADTKLNVNMSSSSSFSSPVDTSSITDGYTDGTSNYYTRKFAPIYPVFSDGNSRILAIDNPITVQYIDPTTYEASTVSKTFFAIRQIDGSKKVYVNSDNYNIGIPGGSDLTDGGEGQTISVFFMDCSGIAEGVNNTATAFARWLELNPDATISSVTDGASSVGATDDGTTSCAVEGIGWIICPMMTFLSSITDASYSLISKSFLKIDSELVSSSGPAYQVWQSFRSIANILFVIVFLIIIFSQLTGAGVTNYGVKKTLPRLVIAAILVNASFFICQIAVDVSNILGFSITQLFTTIPVYSDATTNGLEVAGQALTWVVIVGGVIALAAAAAMAITIPVLLASLLSVLITVLILMGRQAVIMLLVVVSPIAFVAWMLPNTQQWFKQWWKMFYTLLMVFPIVGLLFGAGKLAANVIQVSAGDDAIMQVFALGVASMPLIMTPSLLKGAMSATGTMGAKLSGLSDKANRRVGGKVKETSRAGQLMDYRKQSGKIKRAKINSGAYSGSRWNAIGNASSKLNSMFNDSKISGKFGDRGAAAGTALIDKEEEAEVSNAVAQMRQLHGLGLIGGKTSKGGAQKELEEALKSGDTIKARAATSVLLSSGAIGAEKLHQTVLGYGKKPENARLAETYEAMQKDVNAASLKGTDAALATWSYSSNGDLETIEKTKDTYSGLKMSEMASQTGESLGRASAVGSISQNMAKSILEADTSKTALTDETTSLLTSILNASTNTTAQNIEQPAEATDTGRPTLADFEANEAAELDLRRNNNTPQSTEQNPGFHVDDNGR